MPATEAKISIADNGSAAVYDENLTRGVAGAVGAEKGRGLSDFIRGIHNTASGNIVGGRWR